MSLAPGGPDTLRMFREGLRSAASSAPTKESGEACDEPQHTPDGVGAYRDIGFLSRGAGGGKRRGRRPTLLSELLRLMPRSQRRWARPGRAGAVQAARQSPVAC